MVEKELAKTEKRLSSSGKGTVLKVSLFLYFPPYFIMCKVTLPVCCPPSGVSSSSTEDPLDAFMSAVRSEVALDGVERKKLHLHVAELKKEVQRLRKLADLAKPTQLPSLQPSR